MSATEELVLPDGVEFDRDLRQVRLCGVTLPVGDLVHSPYEEGGSIFTEADIAPGMEVLAEQLHMVGRRRPRMPESIHFTVLCGENGWWLEFAVYPEGPAYKHGLNVSGPGEPIGPDCTAEEALALWRETCARHDGPVVEEYETPWGGREPGTWEWGS